MPQLSKETQAGVLFLLSKAFNVRGISKIVVTDLEGVEAEVDIQVKKSRTKKIELIDEPWAKHLQRIQMSPSARKASFEFSKMMGWDVNESVVTSPSQWKYGAAQMARLCEGDYSLIRRAIDHLNSINFTISTPTSIVKTMALMKISPNKFKDKDTTTIF